MGKHHHRHHHKHHLRQDPSVQITNQIGADANTAATAYNAGAEKALKTLNDMLKEAGEKMDLEVVRCNGEERDGLASLKEVREDINMFDQLGAGAAVVMNQAKTAVERYGKLLSN